MEGLPLGDLQAVDLGEWAVESLRDEVVGTPPEEEVEVEGALGVVAMLEGVQVAKQGEEQEAELGGLAVGMVEAQGVGTLAELAETPSGYQALK